MGDGKDDSPDVVKNKGLIERLDNIEKTLLTAAATCERIEAAVEGSKVGDEKNEAKMGIDATVGRIEELAQFVSRSAFRLESFVKGESK